MFYGVARYLCERLGKQRFEVVPHVSMMQTAFARIKESWDEAYLANLASIPLDRAVVRYALPLATLGWLVASYHNLVYAGIIPERLQPCTQGVSCTEEYVELFGFLSIPMLSWLGFTALTGILIALHRRSPQ